MFIEIAKAGVISDAPTISNIGTNILNFLLSVVGILAIIFLVVAGITYFTAAGDKNRIEQAKNTVTYVILGIAFTMGAMIVIRTIGQFF